MRYLFFLFIGVLVTACSQPQYYRQEGFVYGTTYHIIYESDIDLSEAIQQGLAAINNSLSTFQDSSVISKINQNIPVVVDDYFKNVFIEAEKITKATHGAFDMTVAPLVNLWGFGFSKKDSVSEEQIKSLLSHVGMEKIRLVNNKVVKEDSSTMIDASAIAKGYSVDVVSDILEQNGVSNYLVEIGGELRLKGQNSKGLNWSVGIDKPIDDPLVQKRELQEVVQLSEGALATSGNYRNFYIKEGKKYAHTISPFTGYPVDHQLLGVSVIAPKCMTADAYATAFMVLGWEKSLDVLKSQPELEAYFIISSEGDDFQIEMTPGFKKFIKN